MAINLGVIGLLYALTEPINVSQLQTAVQATSYPNVYVSVSELQIPSIIEIINGVGGYLPFFFGIFGVIALVWNLKTKKAKKEELPAKKPKKPRRRRKANRRVEEERL